MHNRELELKLFLNMKPVIFARRCRNIGAELIIPNRIIDDRRFRQLFEPDPSYQIPILSSAATDISEFSTLTKFIGAKRKRELNGLVYYEAVKPIIQNPKVRIRVEHKKYFLTIKTKRDGSKIISDRDEFTSEIRDPVAVAAFLGNLGYREVSHWQFMRLTYQRDDVTIDLNLNPQLHAWAELEIHKGGFKNRRKLVSLAGELGFAGFDLRPLSLKSYFMECGLTETDLRNMLF